MPPQTQGNTAIPPSVGSSLRAADFLPERFNLAAYFLDHNLEAGRGEAPAVYTRDAVFSYAQVQRTSCQLSRLLSELGVRPEERVLMILPDIPEFVPTWFAILRAGAVIAMVNPLLPPDEILYYLNYTRAAVAVVDEASLARVRPALPHAKYLRHVLVVGGREELTEAGISVLPWSLHTSLSDTHHLADTSRDDIAIWLFTTGSTGKPKAAVHLQHDFAFSTERYARGVLGIQASDLTLSVPKLFFGYATGTNLMFPFSVGASTVLFSERSTPDAIYEHIDRFRPTILTSVPTMINAMLQHPRSATSDLRCLRLVLSAGEALPPELYHRWKDRYGVEILDGIGSAEMFHIYITNAPGDVKPGSLGRIVPGYSARLMGSDGREVPDGEIGALHICGDSAALCYWGDHEKSKATFSGDWCITQDLFRRDTDGYFWYEGRADDLLKVSGLWVSPIEIEHCLLQHSQVAEVCVVGFEDDAGLTRTRAWIVLAPGATELQSLPQRLQAWVKERLALHKYPREIRFVDALPKNDRGKVNRKEIKTWT